MNKVLLTIGMVLLLPSLSASQSVNPQLSAPADDVSAMRRAPIFVPDDFEFIQMAISASNDGETIIVRAGTYVENINFLGKKITVKSADGPLATVIDGNQSGSVVTFENEEGPDSIIQGFTITNGSGSLDPLGDIIGGGIRCSSAAPTIQNNVISQNQADHGGGIGAYGTAAQVRNNVIENNNAVFRGGGMAFKDCLVYRSLVENNLIHGNIADEWGGGIFAGAYSRPEIIGNTITDNAALLDGGGLGCKDAISVIVVNSILWGNTATSDIYVDSGLAPTITYSDVAGGAIGEGNIDADPLFTIGPCGSYYLSQIAAGQAADSPCVDAGDPLSSVPPGTTQTSAKPDRDVVDMGYHFDTVPPDMVFIPGGEFEMGDHFDVGSPDEIPLHIVYISSFWMDVYEVTNREYCDFLVSSYDQGLIDVTNGVVVRAGTQVPYCDTDPHDPDSCIKWDGIAFTVRDERDDHPMVEVSWYGATAYANWLSEEHGLNPCYDFQNQQCLFGAGGFRLPTEAEWEKAARGGEHDPYYQYPWGNTIDGSQANFAYSGDPFETGPWPWTTPIGYYDGNQTPPGVDMINGYGLYDMAGNVREWCNDWFEYHYYSSSPYDNPRGPETGEYRLTRGGSWYGYVSIHRCADRYGHGSPGRRNHLFGFRLIID